MASKQLSHQQYDPSDGETELEIPRKYSRDDLLSLRTNDISRNLPECVNDPRLNSLRFWKNAAYQQHELDAANFYYGDRFSDSRNISSLHLMPAFVKRQIIGGVNSWSKDDMKYRTRKDQDTFLPSTIPKKPIKMTRAMTPPFVPPPPPLKRCSCLHKHQSSPMFESRSTNSGRGSNHCNFHKSDGYVRGLALSPRELSNQPSRLNPYITQLPVEPEWITAGPVSQYETIELRGFDEFKDDYRKEARVSPRKDDECRKQLRFKDPAALGSQQNLIPNKSRNNILCKQNSPTKKCSPEYPMIWRNPPDYQYPEGINSDISLQSTTTWNNVIATTSQYTWSNVQTNDKSTEQLDGCNKNAKKFNPVTTPLRNTTNQLLLDFIQKNSIVAPCPDNSTKICNIPSVEDLEASMRRSGISQQPNTLSMGRIEIEPPNVEQDGCEKKKTRVRFQTDLKDC